MRAPLSIADRATGTARTLRQRLAVPVLVVLVLLLATGSWLLWDNRRLDVTSYEVAVDRRLAADGTSQLLFRGQSPIG